MKIYRFFSVASLFFLLFAAVLLIDSQITNSFASDGINFLPSQNNKIPKTEKNDAKENLDKKPHPGRDSPLWEKKNVNVNELPAIRLLHEGVLRIGKIRINKRASFVSVKGEVNMQKGLVEYLACGPMGKLHESVLKLDVEPYYLQIALLLIDLEPGRKSLKRQGGSGIPDGDEIELWVTWKSKDNKMIKHRAEDLIFNKAAGEPMKQVKWVFTGSQVINGRFMAQVEHSIAATYHDPYAVIDHQSVTGADDRIYFANSEVLPPKGTPVTFVIKSKTQKKNEPFSPKAGAYKK